jgi:DNA-3-methyladenine glycosylase II
VARFKKGFDCQKAKRQLARADSGLAEWMKKIGNLEQTMDWHKPFNVVDALSRAILYQQLHGKAAATIVARVELAINSKLINASALTTVTDLQLRACGVSGNKILALRDLSRRDNAGEIPATRQLQYMNSQQIIDSLVPTRGIGIWTVEMMLMFRLGRPDVLPVDDLGIRKGLQVLDQLPIMPSPKELKQRGEIWAPNQTLASLYLWRIADFDKEQIKRSQT